MLKMIPMHTCDSCVCVCVSVVTCLKGHGYVVGVMIYFALHSWVRSVLDVFCLSLCVLKHLVFILAEFGQSESDSLISCKGSHAIPQDLNVITHT